MAELTGTCQMARLNDKQYAFYFEGQKSKSQIYYSFQLPYTDAGMHVYLQFPSLLLPQFHNTSDLAIGKLGSVNTVFR